MSRYVPLAALAAALLAGSAALAEPPIRTASTDAPPVPAPAAAPPAVIVPSSPDVEPVRPPMAAPDGLDPGATADAPRRCSPSPDGKAHGEVWAGAGTGGYRQAGGVVTQPLGACGSVTVAVDHTQWR